MRCISLVAACLLGLLGGSAQGEPELPYQTRVVGDDVCARSGPAATYYPTDRLPAGTVVDVYRHAAGGWCGIRPPEGSFSWVEARDVRFDAPEPELPVVAVIAGDRVPCRVGSQLSDIRDVVQVRLVDEEVVEVLQEHGSTDGKLWYKIAPPSGEFRWVHRRHLARFDTAAEVSSTDAASAAGWKVAEAKPAGYVEPSSAPCALSKGKDPYTTPGSPSPVPNSPSVAIRVPYTLTPEHFAAALREIEFDLSAAVDRGATARELGLLRRRAQWLADQDPTTVQRRRTQAVLEKIDRYATGSW